MNNPPPGRGRHNNETSTGSSNWCAKQGSYDTQKALLITRYSSSSLAVALSFELHGCETVVR
jgi:hypothetical protein